MTDASCDFCDVEAFRAAEIYIENEFCLYASTHDSANTDLILPGSGIIVPFAHRETPFDLTTNEWTATRDLLIAAKATQDDRLAPDGYTVLWNCYPAAGQEIMHAHLHVIPRFDDEPFATRRSVAHQAAGEYASRPVGSWERWRKLGVTKEGQIVKGGLR
jgi:diadenosine tetraphosphate (Ap4A) HIT family hydrolase